MAKDKFYRNLSDSQLRAAYETINRNIDTGILVDGMQRERQLCHNVAIERGVDLYDKSISSQIDAVRGHIEFYQASQKDIRFVCQQCGKDRMTTPEFYKEHYEGQTKCLVCREWEASRPCK